MCYACTELDFQSLQTLTVFDFFSVPEVLAILCFSHSVGFISGVKQADTASGLSSYTIYPVVGLTSD